MTYINENHDGADAAAFKAMFGRFATGVAVATCAPEDGPPLGITINSLSSVSLDPPLALFCLDNTSSTLQSFLNAGHFALNILSADQAALSNRYAGDHTLDDGDAVTRWESGAPILRDALAVADCTLFDTAGGGDHVILIGRVVRVGHRDDAEPLLYYRGGYGSLSAKS